MLKSIRFNYLYRDSGNYKKFGRKTFSNPAQLSIEEITDKLRERLHGEEFFYPEEVGIEKFRLHRYLDDTSWYEFESVEEIKLQSSHKKLQTINSFILLFKNEM